MKNFIYLSVVFAKDQERKELINISRAVRLIEGKSGTMVCFNSSGSDYITVKENLQAIEKLIN